MDNFALDYIHHRLPPQAREGKLEEGADISAGGCAEIFSKSPPATSVGAHTFPYMPIAFAFFLICSAGPP